MAIGRSIVRQPRVLLFDEPFSSLDLPLRSALREEVVELHRQFGTTWILVTHDQAEALLLGDRVAVLDRGRLLQCGPPRAIYQQPTNRFVATFVGSPPMNILACEVERDGDRLQIHVIAAKQGLSWPMAGSGPPAVWLEGIDRIELGLRPEAIGYGLWPILGSPTLVARRSRRRSSGWSLTDPTSSPPWPSVLISWWPVCPPASPSLSGKLSRSSSTSTGPSGSTPRRAEH